MMKSLLSNKTALIKKRQLMRAYCGDYRQKMLKEDKKKKKGNQLIRGYERRRGCEVKCRVKEACQVCIEVQDLGYGNRRG